MEHRLIKPAGGLGKPDQRRRRAVVLRSRRPFDCTHLTRPARTTIRWLASLRVKAGVARKCKLVGGTQLVTSTSRSLRRRSIISGEIPNRHEMARTSSSRMVIIFPLKSPRCAWIMLR